MGYFNYDHLRFRYEPFPIGYARPIMDESVYKELASTYPERERFVYLEKVGHKFTLSERFNPRQYEDFIATTPVWREFHGWLKSDDFILEVMQTLRAHQIDLGYKKPPSLRKRLLRTFKSVAGWRVGVRQGRLTARFEFSMLPAEGGSVMPHTDSPTKIVTLIISMVDDSEWLPEFGGGTEINRPKNAQMIFNQLNRQASFDEVEMIDVFPFTANQAVVFIKTFNSWHSVRPMTGAGTDALRKTLTINIETT
ncbi:conserved hypothetical protein [uncultured Defluviicoccus sp.]|nr:conserved hypothetical protein [uncultured Defluviicoccus sp.]